MNKNASYNLKFKNGSFRVMQITDIQEIPSISQDTLKLIDGAIEKTKPDLVVFTGDQLKNYGITYFGKNKALKAKSVLERLIKPVIKRNIPFTVAFGNHDAMQVFSLKDQWEYFKTFDSFIDKNVEHLPGCGTFSLPIMSEDKSKIALNFFIFDSHGSAKGGGYEPIDLKQIEWYKAERDFLASKNNGNNVPSFVFQHIPLPEYYNLLKEVHKQTKGAVRAFRTHNNKYYILNQKLVKQGKMLEPPSIPDINTGQFDAFCEKGDIFAIYVGHDHINSFIGNYKGIDMGYTPNCGFNVYGPDIQRGVRIFDFNETNPKEYKTRLITFEELFGKKVSNPIKNFLYNHAPTTVDAAIPLIFKSFGLIAAILIVVALLIKFL